MAAVPQTNASDLHSRLLTGDVRALARAITLIDNEQAESADLLLKMKDKPRRAPVIGFTGAPGAGKSTLINAYISTCRAAGRSIAVVSVDPSSPVSGGAILGDRLRMSEHVSDDGVYIRSIAARGHLGGLCRNIDNIIRLIDAAGWDVIALETVGTGQSEIEIASIADIKIVVNAPGMGDAIQAMKAGVLEIADILVVNKADLPHASQTTRELRAMQKLRSGSAANIAVIETVATDHSGLDELSAAIDHLRETKS
jgi:LAO/AO transport system kinase